MEKKLLEHFMKKSYKKSQTEFRVEKIIKRKGVVDKKDIII